MAKPAEFRVETKYLLGFLAIVILGMMYFMGGAGTPASVTPNIEGVDAETQTLNKVPLSLVPPIEDELIYVSTYDAADYADEAKETLVTGTAKVVIDNDVLETISTSASAAAASSLTFNGGATFGILGDASGYYANYVDNIVMDKKNKPVKLEIRDSAKAKLNIKKLDTHANLTSAAAIGLNEKTDLYYAELADPGDDKYYQHCIWAVNQAENTSLMYMDVEHDGTFDKGSSNFDGEDMDRLEGLDYERWWKEDVVLRDYDVHRTELYVKAAQDKNPTASTNTTLYSVDCEWNLQNGVPIYGPETLADADVGESDLSVLFYMS